MERHYARLLTGLVLFMALLTGCAPFTEYRTQYQLCLNPSTSISRECQSHALQQIPASDGANYLLGFIEFDDQGQIWDRQQMWAVLDKLSSEAASKDLLMVVFVHGWKHSAAPNDTNIETFRQVLAKLSEDESTISRQTGLPARQVAGVYLGWRGESITIPVIDNITFWDRKNTAQKVGHGGVTEVLNRLELIKRDKDSTMNGNSGTRLAIVGHSFGGAVVYAALAQTLESRFVHTTGPAGLQSNIEGFGNLVVLINPAFEANLFSPLSNMSMERGTYFESQLPVMAVLTSEADYATRYAFPAGRIFSTLFEKERDFKRKNAVTRQQETIDEGGANMYTIGHFDPYRTHLLYPAAQVERAKLSKLSSSESIQAVMQASAAWENDQPGSKISLAGLTLERTATSAGRNPYLVVRVNKELIRDHNDIDDPRIVEFIRQLILISAQSPERRDVIKKMFEPPVSP